MILLLRVDDILFYFFGLACNTSHFFGTKFDAMLS